MNLLQSVNTAQLDYFGPLKRFAAAILHEPSENKNTARSFISRENNISKYHFRAF